MPHVDGKEIKRLHVGNKLKHHSHVASEKTHTQVAKETKRYVEVASEKQGNGRYQARQYSSDGKLLPGTRDLIKK